MVCMQHYQQMLIDLTNLLEEKMIRLVDDVKSNLMLYKRDTLKRDQERLKIKE